MALPSRAIGLFVATALVAGGCWLDVWRSQGRAEVRWTVNGTDDTAACVVRGAERVEIRAVDAWGHTGAHETPRCDAFATSFWLEGGYYHLDLTLIDRYGAPVSSTLSTGPFHVSHEDTAHAYVDFDTATLLHVPLSLR